MPSFASDGWSIAVIGTGDMGNSLGPKLAQMGHIITYGTRDPDRESIKRLVELTGPGTTAVSQRDAVVDAEIVILAVPWPPMKQVARNLGDLTGKVVIDISLPFQQAEDGYMESMVETSSAEVIQEWNPGAIVVKTVLASSIVIDDPSIMGRPISTFIASDDRRAKEITAKLAHQLGIIPIDAGPLRHAREIEATVRLWYVPVLQGRPVVWELALQPTNFWPCVWQDDWRGPVGDKDNLAEMPKQEENMPECSEYSPTF